jgi:NRPS condensation-like uncharacterized protein
MLWKSHHVIGDGIGVLLFLSTLHDKYSPTQWIQTTEVLSPFKKVVLLLIKPFILLHAFFYFLIWRSDQNCIKPAGDQTLHGHKKNAILAPMKVATLKKIGHHFNQSTINDVVLSLIAVSMREYMQKRGDQSKSVNMLIPYSLRALPKTAEEHRLCNDFSFLCFTLALSESFEEAIACVKK